jgi:hypothetical protein
MLYKQDLTNHNDVKIDVPTKINEENPVLFIASNPNDREEITIVTHKNDILQTKDNGATWVDLTNNN